jgi:putative addiction module component (TIGR02574 family)
MSMPAIDIEKLAPAERLHLIEDLWQSLRVRPETVAMTQAQRDELDRRLDELDGGDAKTISWADAKHRLRRR